MRQHKHFVRFMMAVFISTGMLGGVLVPSPTIAATDDDNVATVVGADGKILTEGNITGENFGANSNDSAAEYTNSSPVEIRSDAGSVGSSPIATPIENNAKANAPSAVTTGNETEKRLEAQVKIIREIQELRIERAALQKKLAEQDEKIAQLTKDLNLLQKQETNKGK